jgi:lipoprotein-anchoring transpeptidase ErfK/SrfK
MLEDVYSVQPGDTLERVAERYNVPWQLLAKINGIADPQHVRAGDQLKVVRGPFDAMVNLQKYELTLFLRGRYAGRFRIGIGQDQSTPDGEFSVKNKVANPTYYGPNQVIGADDPNNPLGERWIDLGNQIGIHGTNDPRSIGQAESRGCIRLSPGDVEDVYDILSIGSKVVIRR